MRHALAPAPTASMAESRRGTLCQEDFCVQTVSPPEHSPGKLGLTHSIHRDVSCARGDSATSKLGQPTPNQRLQPWLCVRPRAEPAALKCHFPLGNLVGTDIERYMEKKNKKRITVLLLTHSRAQGCPWPRDQEPDLFLPKLRHLPTFLDALAFRTALGCTK